MTETVLRPQLLDASVRRTRCDDLSSEYVPPREPPWSLRVTYRRPEFDAPEVTSVLPLSDEFAAFQVDLYLRAVQRGDRNAARLLFAYLHEEWGHNRLVHRDPAWDTLFSFLAPLAAETPTAA